MKHRLLKGLIVAIGVLGIAEGLARALGGAPTPALTARVVDEDGEWLVRDGQFVRTPYQLEFELAPIPPRPTDKPRVAWLGGSSVRGGNGQLPTHLEAAQLLPTLVDVESLNFAAPGLDSSHHVAMLPEVLGLEPDVLVVYSGHNDLGNVSFQTRFSDPRTVWTMRVRSWLSHSRLFELLDVRVTDLSADRVPPPEAPKVAFDEARRAAAHASYEQSLRWIVRAARSEEVEVVLLTPISNPIAPPVVWACSELHELPDPPMRTRPHHIPPEVPDEACADHAWMRGMNALKTDDVQAAGAHFQAARDLDPTPLRADARMTEIVRRVAKEEGAVLIDTQQRAVEQGGGMEPPEFFQDPVHFTAEGHRFVADAVAETLEARL